MRMLRNGGVMLTAICILLCLTFNYTFPLSRESSKWNILLNNNESLHCDKKSHKNSLKKMPAIESSMKIVNNNIKKFKKKIHCHNVDDDYLSNFNEMVIKKKNPYIDMKEMELKYDNGKNSRQIVDPGVNLFEEPAVCEQENSINVDVSSRGLSGFTIPAELLKNVPTYFRSSAGNAVLSKINIGNIEHENGMRTAISKQQPTRRNPHADLLGALEVDIKQFEENKAVNS